MTTLRRFGATAVAVGVAAYFLLSCDKSTNPVDYTLNIELNPVDGAAVSRNPNNTVYSAGTVVTLTATAYCGYEFVNWSGAQNSEERIFKVTVNRDLSLTANFRQTGEPPTDCDAFIDSRDGKSYGKVTIGDQTWMAENLNYDVPNNTAD